MALKYSITHNGNTWNSTTNLDSIPLSNGSTTSSITTAGTRTLNCAGKVAANNLVIGAKTLNCAGKIMAGNVTITAQNATKQRFAFTTSGGATSYGNFFYCDAKNNPGTGSHWKTVRLEKGTSFSSIASDNNNTVCMISENANSSTTNVRGAISTDGGLSWSFYYVDGNVSGIIYSLCYGNGVFVGVGTGKDSKGQIIYSTNGRNWSYAMQGVDPAGPNASGNTFGYVTYINNKFWALAKKENFYLYTSVDGVNWTRGALIPKISSVFTQTAVPREIVYGNGTYVILFNTSATMPFTMCSSDGVTWNKGTTSYSRAGYLCYGAGIFVALPEASTSSVMTSSDGLNWSSSNIGDTINGRGICFGDGIFALKDSRIYVTASSDGTSWTPFSLITTASGGNRLIAFGISDSAS